MFVVARKYITALSLALLLLAFAGEQAFSLTYTLDSRDDAGSIPGQAAYAQFLGSDGNVYPINFATAPTSAQPIYDAAPPNIGWTVEAAGNVWSTDTIVGDSYSFPAGAYRIDAVSGGFKYDSFGWSQVANVPPLWFMNIRAQENSGTYADNTLGPFLGQDVDGTLQLYTYVILKGPGSLTFWITDGNSLDNNGALTFAITSVPAPPSLFLLAGGLPFLLPRVRKLLGR